MTAGTAGPTAGRIEKGRPEASHAWRTAPWRVPAVAAAIFFAAHLAFLGPTLDDIDAVNFAFGVRAFDPALHHPHPPGYPVYIALGKLSSLAAAAVRPATALAPIALDPAAWALAVWSALFGALALLACWAVWRQLDAIQASVREEDEWPRGRAAWAALAFAVSPLGWITASRPMSDVPGLAAALLAQALLLAAWRREEVDGAGTTPGTLLAMGTFTAGLALGIRSQVLWLTLPLVVAVVVTRGRHQGLTAALPSVGAYGGGVLAWALPMIVAIGDWRRYLRALGGQGAEDFSGVDMLWTHFGVRRLLVGLWDTFVLPWSSVPLAVIVLAAAMAGLVVMWRRARVALAIVVLLAGPYAVFHSLFHETFTTRYALPLMPAVCYLAVRGASVLGRRAAAAFVVVVLAWSLVVALPATRAYASAPSPIFQALGRLHEAAAEDGSQGVLGLHRRVATEAKPALAWAAVEPWARRLPSPRGGEWAEALAVLRQEPQRPVWFLGEPSRRGELRVRDLALVDPRAVRSIQAFEWNLDATALLGGVRPGAVDLYEIKAPGWIAGEGWALTPETAGIAAKRHRGPLYGPIDALVRRRAGAAFILVGGRHLGTAEDGAARVEALVDGRTAATFDVEVEPRFFLRVLTLPPGGLEGPGAFATFTLRVSPRGGGARPVPIAIEQFDVDDAGGLLAGYEAGWQEAEYDPSRQQLWRWMSERATVLVQGAETRGLTLTLTAESPRRYFERPSEVRVRVGDRVLARTTPDAGWPRLLARAAGLRTFSMTVPIDREALARASNRVTLEADQFFVPASRDQNADRRHLALRVLDLRITSDKP